METVWRPIQLFLRRSRKRAGYAVNPFALKNARSMNMDFPFMRGATSQKWRFLAEAQFPAGSPALRSGAYKNVAHGQRET
jgi:hypothetical protein